MHECTTRIYIYIYISEKDVPNCIQPKGAYHRQFSLIFNGFNSVL